MAEEQNGFQKECLNIDPNILPQIINRKRMEYNLETLCFLSIKKKHSTICKDFIRYFNI